MWIKTLFCNLCLMVFSFNLYGCIFKLDALKSRLNNEELCNLENENVYMTFDNDSQTYLIPNASFERLRQKYNSMITDDNLPGHFLARQKQRYLCSRYYPLNALECKGFKDNEDWDTPFNLLKHNSTNKIICSSKKDKKATMSLGSIRAFQHDIYMSNEGYTLTKEDFDESNAISQDNLNPSLIGTKVYLIDNASYYKITKTCKNLSQDNYIAYLENSKYPLATQIGARKFLFVDSLNNNNALRLLPVYKKEIKNIFFRFVKKIMKKNAWRVRFTLFSNLNLSLDKFKELAMLDTYNNQYYNNFIAEVIGIKLGQEAKTAWNDYIDEMNGFIDNHKEVLSDIDGFSPVFLRVLPIFEDSKIQIDTEANLFYELHDKNMVIWLHKKITEREKIYY